MSKLYHLHAAGDRGTRATQRRNVGIRENVEANVFQESPPPRPGCQAFLHFVAGIPHPMGGTREHGHRAAGGFLDRPERLLCAASVGRHHRVGCARAIYGDVAISAHVAGGVARIETSTMLKEVYAKTGRSGKMVFVVWETSFTNQNNEDVARVRESYVRRNSRQ